MKKTHITIFVLINVLLIIGLTSAANNGQIGELFKYVTSDTDGIDQDAVTPGIQGYRIDGKNVITDFGEKGAIFASGSSETVGIGELDSSYKLNVDGNVNIDGTFSQNGTVISLGGAETDPQVGANTTNYLSKWNGNALATSSVYDNGNVGIGTTSPSVKLEVNGDIKWSNSQLRTDQGGSIELGSNGTPYIDFKNDTTSDYDSRIILRNDDLLSIEGSRLKISTNNAGIWYENGTNDWFVGKDGTTDGGNFRWHNNGNRMSLTPDGKLGIGTNSPSAKLEVKTINSTIPVLNAGYNTEATGGASSAIGYQSIASGQYSTAIGNNTKASGSYATAIGNYTEASGNFGATAIGNNTKASGKYSTAMGLRTEASGESSTAMGYLSIASGNYGSTAIGYKSIASGNFSTAVGRETKASGLYSITMGQTTEASGRNSIAIGKRAIASGDYSTIIGNGYNSYYKIENNINNSFAVGYMNSYTDTTPEFMVEDGKVSINGSINFGTYTQKETCYNGDRAIVYRQLSTHCGAGGSFGCTTGSTSWEINNNKKSCTYDDWGTTVCHSTTVVLCQAKTY